VSRPLGDHGGKVAVVTGGAGAIGGAIASAMSVAGVRVAVWDLDGGRAVEVASDLDRDAAGVEVDITSRSSVLSAAVTTESELGPIDILVNAAGIDVIEHS
jgi:NAD(P)-dependent dehydrogenase (short-subunit alcohol dehydrogenase family)